MFCALDTMLIFLLGNESAAGLFLTAQWSAGGTGRRGAVSASANAGRSAATRYVLDHGCRRRAAAVRAVAARADAGMHFDLPTLLAVSPSRGLQLLCLLLFLLGFGIKEPLVPLHSGCCRWRWPAGNDDGAAGRAEARRLWLLRLVVRWRRWRHGNRNWLLGGWVRSASTVRLAALAVGNLRSVQACASICVGLAVLGLAASVAGLQGSLCC